MTSGFILLVNLHERQLFLLCYLYIFMEFFLLSYFVQQSKRLPAVSWRGTVSESVRSAS